MSNERPKFGSRKSDLSLIAGVLIALSGVYFLSQPDATNGGILLIVVGALIAIPGLVAVGIRFASDEREQSR